MHIPGYDPRYEPANIKAVLPLEWVLGELYGVGGAGSGQMIRCPLPWHQERTASFNLWAPNDDGIPQRFGCFGCGSTGDVIDLIAAARNVGFTEACDIAVDELIPRFTDSDWQPSDGPAEKQYASPAALENALEALQPAPIHLQLFIDKKAEKDPAFRQLPYWYLEREWRWKGGYVGMPVVVFPHWDWNHELHGIKYRSVRRDTRWNEKGSGFVALYGAWKDCNFNTVVLCEGETDTVFAAWQLQEEHIDVLGLPTGAGQKPPEEAVKRLAGRRVYLAFDADMAGRIAFNRWSEALTESDVRVVPIPDGEDICSCNIPIRDLLRGAQ